MKTIAVVQHNSAEYLGLIEDHLEGRGTRFQYFRPFTSDGKLPTDQTMGDGLVLLGGGPWGSVGENKLPTLDAEIDLTRNAISRSIPVLGIGLGAHILALATGGSVSPAPLRMRVGTATCQNRTALSGLIPESFPAVVYMRDKLTLPPGATLLADLPGEDPAIWQIGPCCLGFAGHPGLKPGMVEDLVMEFDDVPPEVHSGLTQLQQVKNQIADALVPIMTGLVRQNEWM